MTTVHLVPHTHWDREWYRPFQAFRMQLVELVDQVLQMLEADPRFSFTLDGQLATVDDYLAIRPEAEERIRHFVTSGRLAIGPWQILMDEFLCSGETMIRNLEIGMRRAAELGGTMEVGYLPDMFGHVAQMPQLLRGVGIDNAVVWRGVPAAIDRHRFSWCAPDGSSVATEYLAEGYGNAAYLFALPGRLVDKLPLLHRSLRPFFGDDPLLAMYGSDHTAPRRDLMAVVDELNAGEAGYELKVDTLAEYAADTRQEDDGPRWRGELRSSARANMLMGVNSARIDLKQATGRAERALERYAEPMQALWGDPDAWPTAYLDLAWRRMIENSAHDSICGCSTDPVISQVLVRYAEAEQVAHGLADRAARRVADSVPGDGFAILNPSPFERRGLVELSLPIPEAWEAVALEIGERRRVPTQELDRSERAVWMAEMPGREVSLIRRRIHGRELFGRHLVAFVTGEVEGMSELTLEVDDDPTGWFDVDEMLRAVELGAEAAPDQPWRVRVVAVARRRLLAEVPVPALGWAAVRAVDASAAIEQPVEAAEHRLSNGLLTVSVAADGTLRVEAADGAVLDGVGRLVDGGDEGDSYNYAPPARDAPIDEPIGVERVLEERGPLRGVIRVLRTYRWPRGLHEGGRSSETDEVRVALSCELRSGEPFVRLALALENPSEDHRLRLHIPLAHEAVSSAAEGQFAVVERRSGEPDGGHGELPLPTYPARTFVSAGGAAVLSRHVVEYELVEGRELAITVLRATGLISRNENAYREEPAGPQVAIPDGQCRGPWRFELAVMPHTGTWADAGVLEAAERYRHELLVAPGAASASAELPAPAPGLELQGRGVTLSSLRRRDGWLELRLACEAQEPQEALIRGAFTEAREVDLRGEPGSGLSVTEGLLRLSLDAWQIRTVQLR
jgi:mannosylglycerate hydrolase